MLQNYKMDLLIIFAQELLLKYEANSAKNTNISFWSKYNWSQTANAAPNKVSCWKKCGDRSAAPSAAVSVLVRQRSLSFAGKAVFLLSENHISHFFSASLAAFCASFKICSKIANFPPVLIIFPQQEHWTLLGFLLMSWCHSSDKIPSKHFLIDSTLLYQVK